jgi:hypothetical protein
MFPNRTFTPGIVNISVQTIKWVWNVKHMGWLRHTAILLLRMILGTKFWYKLSVYLYNPSNTTKTYIILLKAICFDFRKSSSGLS